MTNFQYRDGELYCEDLPVAKLAEQSVSMIGWMSHLVLAPPLILTEGQLDDCVAALDEALKVTDALVA